MTANKPDLSDLIKRNQQLEKENAGLRKELAKMRSTQILRPHNENRPIDYVQVITESPKPKFQVGDNVLVDFYGIDKTIRRQARITAIEKAMKYGDEIDVYRVWFDGSEAPAEVLFEEGRISLNPYRPKDE